MRKIEEIKPVIRKAKSHKKVCAYTRVSVSTDRTLNSLSSQITYYSKLIQSNSEWVYKGVYSDKAISGTSTDRPEFQRMLSDAYSGNIDIILTKSISRFARNTVDLLETVRKLKEIGVEVRFEKERINSLSGDGELMLSILASFAEEESRAISENVKWGIKKRFEKGIPNGIKSMFGYDCIDKKLYINDKEAEIVRFIYKRFLEGVSCIQIGKDLNEKGILTVTGKIWRDTNVRHILKNISYTGNMLLQKEYVVDPITGKRKLNKGELPQYFVENTHEEIISMEDFKKTEIEFKRRSNGGAFWNPAINTTALTGKIICKPCAKPYHSAARKLVNGKSKFWTCGSKKSGKRCKGNTCNIKDEIIKEMIAKKLSMDEFDEEVFLKEISKIEVYDSNKLIFYFKNGRIEKDTYIAKKRENHWNEEKRKKWGEIRSDARKKPKNRTHSELTGFIKCDICSMNYRSNGWTTVDGQNKRAWKCYSEKHKSYCKILRDKKIKDKVCTLLDLDEFDRDKMLSKIKEIRVKDDAAFFIFNDGKEEKVEISEL